MLLYFSFIFFPSYLLKRLHFERAMTMVDHLPDDLFFWEIEVWMNKKRREEMSDDGREERR